MTKKCILLTCDDPRVADAAETYATRLFDVQRSWRHSRADKRLAPEILDTIAKGETEYLFSFLSPVIIPAQVLQQVRKQCINFHPAPPEWPGIGSASFALYHNDEKFGVSAHVMTKEIDAGPIIGVIRFPILANDTCETLFDRGKSYLLLLFYEVLAQIDKTGGVEASAETWKRKAITRREFERWMTVSMDDPPDEIKRKARALRHSRLPGPVMEVAGVRFEVPPSGRS